MFFTGVRLHSAPILLPHLLWRSLVGPQLLYDGCAEEVLQLLLQVVVGQIHETSGRLVPHTEHCRIISCNIIVVALSMSYYHCPIIIVALYHCCIIIVALLLSHYFCRIISLSHYITVALSMSHYQCRIIIVALSLSHYYCRIIIVALLLSHYITVALSLSHYYCRIINVA